jgi:hypothetical protein
MLIARPKPRSRDWFNASPGTWAPRSAPNTKRPTCGSSSSPPWLTNSAITKAHTVTVSAVTAVDPDADTVSGTAAPDTEVGVRPCDPSGCYNGYATADASGAWSADLSGIYDIIPGSGGEAFQNDSDGDFTSVS